MSGELNRLNFSADIEVIYPPVEVSNRRVSGIVRSEDIHGLFDLVKGVDVLDREDGQCLVISGVEQSEAHARLQSEGLDF